MSNIQNVLTQDNTDFSLKNRLRQEQALIIGDLSSESFEAAKSTGDIHNLERVGALRKKARNFDHLVQTHFSQEVGKKSITQETLFGYRSPHLGKWITELRIRYLTNSNLTEHKVNALLRIMSVYDVEYRNQAAPSNAIGSIVMRLKNIIDIQVNTRLEEARIQLHIEEKRALHKKNPALNAVTTVSTACSNIEGAADFIRDLETLRILGFMAPQISSMLATYGRHSQLEIDRSVLNIHRDAIEAALLTFYWKDPRYFESFRADKNSQNSPGIPAIKGAAPIPVENPNIRFGDDREKDYNIGRFPAELIPVLSEYVRSIVYNLTRKTAPSIRETKGHASTKKWTLKPPASSKFASFIFSRLRDPYRITLAQEKELARLRSEKSRS